MNKVAVEGMRFYAYHGFYEEEQILGNNYLIDVYVQTDFTEAKEMDDLNGTVNYEAIYNTTKEVMAVNVKLLEHVGQQIATQLKQQFEIIQKITVRVSKLNPPFGGDVARSFIEITETY